MANLPFQAGRPSKGDVVRLNFSAAKLAEIRASFDGVESNIRKVLIGSINQTLIEGRKFARQKLGDYLTIKKSIINKRIAITKASAASSTANITGRLKVLGYKTPLINFTTKDTKRTGVDWTATKGGSSTNEKSAFIRMTKNGRGKQVLRRVGNERYPLARLYGPSVFQLYKSSPVEGEVDQYVATRLNFNVSGQIDKALLAKR